jgi:hypothetical protein
MKLNYEAARKARITGIVIVEVVIDKEGVAGATVLKPLPFGLSEAVLESVPGGPSSRACSTASRWTSSTT